LLPCLAVTFKYAPDFLSRRITPLVKAKLKPIVFTVILASAACAICFWLFPRPSLPSRAEFTIERGMTGLYSSFNTETQAVTEVVEHSRQSDSASSLGDADQLLAAAFHNQRSNVQVQGAGRVTKVLADDNEGSRHQRFILKLASGQTLLVAHNIDLASRVISLKAWDYVEFNGEYEWNSKGGIIHWTHRDPEGRHTSGWVKLNGRTYQ